MLSKNLSDTSSAIYTDFSSLKQLEHKAKDQQEQTIDKVAKQFEAIFIQMVMQNMRNANLPISSGIFDSNQMNMYQDLYDKQLSLNLSEKGIGLADLIKQQLGHGANKINPKSGSKSLAEPFALQNVLIKHIKNQVHDINKINSNDHSLNSGSLNLAPQTENNPNNVKSNFIQKLWQGAKQASQVLGVHPAVLIAQAALETDWGRKVIQSKDGQSSNNLFNIKAGSSWDKDKVFVKTLEHKNGVVQKELAAFRSYPSLNESFHDYINLLKNNPRYNDAVSHANDPKMYLKGLQTGGYATDPHYADKILNILDSEPFQNLFSSK